GGSRRFNEFRRPKYLFSGLTKCGVCGAGFIVYSRHHLGCFGSRDRGTCTNKLTIAREEVEARVLRALQDKLMRKDFFEELCRYSIRRSPTSTVPRSRASPQRCNIRTLGWKRLKCSVGSLTRSS